MRLSKIPKSGDESGRIGGVELGSAIYALSSLTLNHSHMVLEA